MKDRIPLRPRPIQTRRVSGRGGYPSLTIRWAVADNGECWTSASGLLRTWGTREAAEKAIQTRERREQKVLLAWVASEGVVCAHQLTGVERRNAVALTRQGKLLSEAGDGCGRRHYRVA